jgi:hypothetical protein
MTKWSGYGPSGGVRSGHDRLGGNANGPAFMPHHYWQQYLYPNRNKDKANISSNAHGNQVY